MISPRAIIESKRLLDECGITDPTMIPLESIVASKNVFLKEEPIDGSDGRILIGENHAVITVNSNIDIPSKKRFVISHELGHLLLHKNQELFFKDTDDMLNDWYQSNYGKKEMEANAFASEFLMPSDLFQRFCKGKKFSPDIVDNLSERFQVSKTATILKYISKGWYPITIVYFSSKKMKWWQKSKEFPGYLNFSPNDKPPFGSVAEEYLLKDTFYCDDERQQKVFKSVWFDLKYGEPDKLINEYCLYAKSYNYLISVLWED